MSTTVSSGSATRAARRCRPGCGSTRRWCRPGDEVGVGDHVGRPVVAEAEDAARRGRAGWTFIGAPPRPGPAGPAAARVDEVAVLAQPLHQHAVVRGADPCSSRLVRTAPSGCRRGRGVPSSSPSARVNMPFGRRDHHPPGRGCARPGRRCGRLSISPGAAARSSGRLERQQLDAGQLALGDAGRACRPGGSSMSGGDAEVAAASAWHRSQRTGRVTWRTRRASRSRPSVTAVPSALDSRIRSRVARRHGSPANAASVSSAGAMYVGVERAGHRQRPDRAPAGGSAASFSSASSGAGGDDLAGAVDGWPG